MTIESKEYVENHMYWFSVAFPRRWSKIWLKYVVMTLCSNLPVLGNASEWCNTVALVENASCNLDVIDWESWLRAVHYKGAKTYFQSAKLFLQENYWIEYPYHAAEIPSFLHDYTVLPNDRKITEYKRRYLDIYSVEMMKAFKKEEAILTRLCSEARLESLRTFN